jgi:hypothetical protein
MRVLGFRVNRHENSDTTRTNLVSQNRTIATWLGLRPINAYGAISLLLPPLECLLDKLRHNAVFGSPKPILDRRTGFVEY